MRIRIEPLGPVDPSVLSFLGGKLAEVFGCKAATGKGVENLRAAYDSGRQQYLASSLLDSPELSGRRERVLGVADADLYVAGLNFVFGQADMRSGAAVMSVYRLRQEYYGLPEDKALFQERVLKEAVHELGHTFGLGHCPDLRCVMHFSNTLADTDWKTASFCSGCRPKLPL